MKSDIPASFVVLSDLIGVEAACEIVRLYGGGRLWVCIHFPDNHPLIWKIGRERCDTLSREYSGEWLAIPLFNKSRRIKAEQEVATLLKTLSPNEIAIRLGISRRTIYRIKSALIRDKAN